MSTQDINESWFGVYLAVFPGKGIPVRLLDARPIRALDHRGRVVLYRHVETFDTHEKWWCPEGRIVVRPRSGALHTGVAL